MTSERDTAGPSAAPMVADERPTPQPERAEPLVDDPQLGDLSSRDYRAIALRAAKSTLADNVTKLAAAVAYNLFLAIPAALLVGLGAFSLLAGPAAVETIMRHLRSVMPGSAVSLLGGDLTRVTAAHRGGVAMVVVGAVVALWSLSSAMQTVMWALNVAHGRDEGRGFVARRLTALAMIAAGGLAFVLVAVLLIMGPYMVGWIGSAVGDTTAVTWVWWVAQWPVLVAGMLAAFAVVLHLGPDVKPRSWRFVTPGSVFAVVVWLAASAAFSYYASRFASYNKTWGSLSAVIVLLTWLWLSALAVLVGGEINAEVERSRRLRQRGGVRPGLPDATRG
jgi:membrane protein